MSSARKLRDNLFDLPNLTKLILNTSCCIEKIYSELPSSFPTSLSPSPPLPLPLFLGGSCRCGWTRALRSSSPLPSVRGVWQPWAATTSSTTTATGRGTAEGHMPAHVWEGWVLMAGPVLLLYYQGATGCVKLTFWAHFPNWPSFFLSFLSPFPLPTFWNPIFVFSFPFFCSFSLPSLHCLLISP